MSKIKGQNFRAFYGGSAIAAATSCTVTLTGNTEDSSTKDTEGMYNADSIVSTSWSIQVDTLDDTNVSALVTAFTAGAEVTVGWDQTETTAGTQNRTAAEASFSRTGSAYLTDVTLTFNDRVNISTSAQFTGTGALS